MFCRVSGPSQQLPQHEVTRLLARLGTRDREAEGALIALLGDELKRIARAQLAGSRPGHTLQATALLGEAWLRLARVDGFEGREHFLAVAARAMRSVLVDHERKRRAAKREGARAELDLDGLVAPGAADFDVLDVEAALEALERVDPVLVRTTELLFHSGLTAAEAAAVLGVSSRTVERQWRTAKAFLRSFLDEDGDGREA